MGGHCLAAQPPGPVPLRPMPPLTRPRAPAIRLAAPAEHRDQRAPPEIPHPAQLGIQPRPLRLQPRQIQPLSHGASSENEPISEWRHTQLRSTTPTFVSHTRPGCRCQQRCGWICQANPALWPPPFLARSLAGPRAPGRLANRGPRRAALTTASFPGGRIFSYPRPAGPAVEAGGDYVQHLPTRDVMRVSAAHLVSLPATSPAEGCCG